MIEFAEGISSFIAVVKRDGIKTLEIDRMWQGQNQKSYQILAAHIPMLLHQDPKSVLVIGMGTGQTASRFLSYDIEHLDCVDIEAALPGILRRHFDAAWLSDRRSPADYRCQRADHRHADLYRSQEAVRILLELFDDHCPGVTLCDQPGDGTFAGGYDG